MKNALAALLLIVMALSLAACGSAAGGGVPVSAAPIIETGSGSPESSSEDTDTNTDTKILIACFSRADENYGVGYIEKGNTAIIAEMIAGQTGGELFHIERSTPYPADYDGCTDEARREQNENARPELLSDHDIEDYDVIFLGYPNWWGDMPMAVYTWLEAHDFTGKTIVPFCTHAGSGLGSTERSIQA